MGIARNLARLVPNGSGLLPNANIEAMAASKLTGQVADANAPSGSVIQVVSTNVTGNFSTSSGSFVHATNHSLSITTSVANSRIILFCNTPIQLQATTSATLGATTFRSSLDSYAANIGETINVNTTDAGSGWIEQATLHSVHSPAQSASTAITYRVYVRCSASTLYFPDPWGFGSFSFNFMAMEIAP
jgi:hypothetical protein